MMRRDQSGNKGYGMSIFAQDIHDLVAEIHVQHTGLLMPGSTQERKRVDVATDGALRHQIKWQRLRTAGDQQLFGIALADVL